MIFVDAGGGATLAEDSARLLRLEYCQAVTDVRRYATVDEPTAVALAALQLRADEATTDAPDVVRYNHHRMRPLMRDNDGPCQTWTLYT